MLIEHNCPFCNFYTDEQYVVQAICKSVRKMQFFHTDCFNEHTRGVKHGKLSKQSRCNVT